jgi:hypothetical protein
MSLPLVEAQIDVALRVLTNTNDGNDLTEHELRLVEHAVNERLSTSGEQALDALDERAAQKSLR